MASPAPFYGQYRIPGVDEQVHFGVGQPAPSLLPLTRVRAATAAKLAEEDPLLLQYGFISGYATFRASLARFLEAGYGKPAGSIDPELLFATNGVSGALGLVCSLFAGRGDSCVVENPSYFLALSIFRDFGIRTTPCRLDEQGLDTAELERMLRADAGFRPKFVYCIPAFHNPTGYSLSAERKAHLCCLAAEFDFLVLADEVYQLLGFESAPRPADPLCYFDTPEVVAAGGRGGSAGHVLSIGSFAKILAPGMRLGWMQASAAGAHLLKRIGGCGQLDSSGALNPVISGVVHELIDSGSQAEHLRAVRAELTQRGATLGDALRASLPPGATFVQPQGGYFIWIAIPPPLHGMRLMDYCIAKHRCRFHPGERFGSGLDSFIRLSFSYYGAADLAVGAQRLGTAMREMIAAGAPAPALAPAPAAPAGAAAAGGVAIMMNGLPGAMGREISAAALRRGVHLAPFALTGPGCGGEVDVGGVVVRLYEPTERAALAARLAAEFPRRGSLVAVDFTHPSAVNENAAWYASLGLPFVMGTTGGDRAALLRDAGAAGVYCVIAPNMCKQIVALQAALTRMAADFPGAFDGYALRVVESHQASKADTSGTAKAISDQLSLLVGGAPFDHAAIERVREPAAQVAGGGAAHAGVSPVPAAALDGHAFHTYSLAADGVEFQIRHNVAGRSTYAEGAVDAVKFLAARVAAASEQRRYDMMDVLRAGAMV